MASLDPKREPEQRLTPNYLTRNTLIIAATLLTINISAISWFITQQAQQPNTNTAPRPQRTTTPATQPTPINNPTMQLLNTLPATSTNTDTPSVHAFLDFECPFCQQFVDTHAWTTAVDLATAGRINLSVNPVAFLTPNSQLKANLFNCSTPHAHPTAINDLITALKTPGNVPSRDLPLQWVSSNERDACFLDDTDLARAMGVAQRLGVDSVPTVFVDGVSVPWPDFGRSLAAAVEVGE